MWLTSTSILIFFFFLWMFRWLIYWGFLALVGFASSSGQVSWLCLTQCIGFYFSYFKQISMPSLLVFTFLLPSFTRATSRFLCIFFVLCRICSMLYFVLCYEIIPMTLISQGIEALLKFTKHRIVSEHRTKYDIEQTLYKGNDLWLW